MLSVEYLKRLGYVEVIRKDKRGNELYLNRYPLGSAFHDHKYYKRLCDIYSLTNDSGLAEFGSDMRFVKFYTYSDDGYKAICTLSQKWKEWVESISFYPVNQFFKIKNKHEAVLEYKKVKV